MLSRKAEQAKTVRQSLERKQVRIFVNLVRLMPFAAIDEI